MAKENKYGDINELLPDTSEDSKESVSKPKRRRPSPALGAMQGERSPLSVTDALKKDKVNAERALEDAQKTFEQEKKELLKQIEAKQSADNSSPIVLTMPITKQEVVFELHRIDPSKIDVSPENERIQEFLDEISLSDILPSIKKHGQQFPGTVRPKKDGRFELIEGSRRLRASVLAKKDYLALVGEVPDADIRELSIIENKHQDVSFYEKAKAWERQIENGEFQSWHQLAAIRGMSSSNMNRYKACAELHQDFVRILPSPSDMPLVYGEMIAKLKKKDEKNLSDKVSELLDLRKKSLAKGPDLLGVEDVIKELKSSVRVKQVKPKTWKPIVYASKNGDRTLKHSVSSKGTNKFELDGVDDKELKEIVDVLMRKLGVEMKGQD